MGFPKQEYWSGLSCPLPGDLLDPGIELTSLTPLALAGGFYTTSATREACMCICIYTYVYVYIHIYTHIYIREGNGTPLQYSFLENPMDRGIWRAAVHGVTECQTQLSETHTQTHTQTHTESEMTERLTHTHTQSRTRLSDSYTHTESDTTE